MLMTRFWVFLRPDTEDPDEAMEEAKELQKMIRESWHGTVEFGNEIRVMDWSDYAD